MDGVVPAHVGQHCYWEAASQSSVRYARLSIQADTPNQAVTSRGAATFITQALRIVPNAVTESVYLCRFRLVDCRSGDADALRILRVMRHTGSPS